MRTVIRWVIRICIALLSIESIIALIDNLGRWEWLEGKMLAHPEIAALTHGPTFPLFCLGVCFASVYGERYLKMPDIRAIYLNCRLNPDLSTATLQDAFNTEAKTPGWDEKEIGWHCLFDVRLANHSETPVTIEEMEAIVRVGGNKWLRKIFPFARKKIRLKLIKDLSAFKAGPHEDNPGYTPLDCLLPKIKGVPLEKGVGYRGWLGFKGRATQGELFDHPVIDVTLIDALEAKHKLIYRKDEKSWDLSFNIVPN